MFGAGYFSGYFSVRTSEPTKETERSDYHEQNS